MDFRYLFFRFWYLLWFVMLPLGVAWMFVDILDRANVVDEFELWYVLLTFALLVVGIYSIKDKLPFWKDRDSNSPFNQRRRAAIAEGLSKRTAKILKKKGYKVSERGRTEINSAITSLQKALDQEDHERIISLTLKLEEKTNRYMAFARKSAVREYFESIGFAVLVAVVLRLFVVEAFKIPSESMVPTLMVGDHIFVSKYLYGLSVPFMNKRLVNFATPARGEVIVFVKPSAEEQNRSNNKSLPPTLSGYEMVGKDFIKRIAGLPGDKIEMKNGTLFVNDKKLQRCHVGNRTYRTKDGNRGKWKDETAELWIEKNGDYLYTVAEDRNAAPFQNNFGPMTVPDGQVFVLGDNRDNSNDSRYWGSVPFDNIKGRAMFIWWSNRPPHGFQWDRVGDFIMHDPNLSEAQTKKLNDCKIISEE